ncbi:hypothetical protein ACFSHQ_13560 [Gemmobacter lanyuensis]
MLSAARDQQALIKSYASNAASADNRLSLADAAMGEMSALMRQVKDVALQMANTATSEIGYATLRSEAAQLREALVGVANTRDAAGQPLFSGLSSETPFRVTPQGVTYGGDTGQTQVQISESLRVMTGLSGADLLMSVPTEQGCAASLTSSRISTPRCLPWPAPSPGLRPCRGQTGSHHLDPSQTGDLHPVRPCGRGRGGCFASDRRAGPGD